ncbi:MAG: hypothetical protein O2931_08745 [Planctomycetota bacterium]|nr:hypothetical protein [Planctomycetota bacterium]MDA1178869.1 hypothetical protein [Planctomycetota bacterium]
MTDSTKLQLRPVGEISCEGDLLSIVRDSSTGNLFVGGARGQIATLDLATEPKFLSTWAAHVSHVSSLVLAGEYLISAGSDHRVLWWDRESHRPIRINEEHPQWVRCLAISPQQNVLATVCDDMLCRTWDIDSGKLIHELRGHELLTPKFHRSKLYTCAFSSDGSRLATADQIGRICVWDHETGKLLSQIEAPHFFTHDTNGHGYGGIRGLAFSPNGQQIAACGNQAGDTSTISSSKSLIRIFDWASGRQTHECTTGGNFFYERVLFHPNGNALFSAGGAGSDQKVVLYDLLSNSVTHQQPTPMLVFDMQLSENAETLFSVGRKDQKGHFTKWVIEPTSEKPSDS